MNLLRIGDKVLSRAKIDNRISEILRMRMLGMSQLEVGEKLNVERTFISRLEGLGEVRKGQSIAAIGFPVKNKEEVEKILRAYGVEFYLLMSETERNEFVGSSTGNQLINLIIDLTNKFRSYDTVIIMASDYRRRIMKGMLDNQVIEIDMGKSPLREDVTVEIKILEEILIALKG